MNQTRDTFKEMHRWNTAFQEEITTELNVNFQRDLVAAHYLNGLMAVLATIFILGTAFNVFVYRRMKG